MGVVRLAELLGALSFASDLADGFPQGKVVRTVVLGTRIAEAAQLSREEARDVFYVTLLRYLGCTGFAHEESAIYGAGEDIVVRNVMAMADPDDMGGTLRAIVGRVGRGAGPIARARAVAALLDPGAVEKHAHAQCDTSIRVAELVGLGALASALGALCERWDGEGKPHGTKGEALPLAVRVHHLADVAETAHHRGGAAAMRAAVKTRTGGLLDPALVARFVAREAEMIATLDEGGAWDRFLAAEPEPRVECDEARFDDVVRALGYFGDMKSTYFLGHSATVAELGARTAEALGMPAAEIATVRRAGHLHDLGRLSVPNAIWDRAGALDAAEWERVRLHAYYTDRVLTRSPALREVAAAAGGSHERLGGDGYHRGIPAPMLTRGARVIAVADALAAMGEERPHRGALSADAKAKALRDESAKGALDREIVEAALSCVGLAAPRARRGDLSERELEVLRLVARGKTNKEIAELLKISAKTVQHHVAHVYDKIGVYSRAGAAMYVMENGLYA